jgi:hypothetical protein
MTAMARQGKLDPVIGCDEEILRSIQILFRRTKNNPALIGEPGVGCAGYFACLSGFAMIFGQFSPRIANLTEILTDEQCSQHNYPSGWKKRNCPKSRNRIPGGISSTAKH